ncbi:MAG: DUF2162 domain-containing protein [Deltaproteobacteria bacterium]|nr:DUF2162 domain-containing protein [Deltaproteobacteria bacterium]
MELKSLFLGILFSVGIFGIKAGAGLHYRMSRENRFGVRWGACLGFAGLYGVLFAGIAAGLRHINIQADFENIQRFLKGGMLIHFALACLMLAWGVALLKSRGIVQHRSLDWLAWVLPCPVCMTVIGIFVAFILAVFPDAAAGSVLMFYLAFLTLSFLTAASMGKLEKRLSRSPEALLGSAMTIIATYFLLSILIMPQFSGLDEVYRLAAHSSEGTETAERTAWPTIGASAALFGAGYLNMRRRIQTATLSRHGDE